MPFYETFSEFFEGQLNSLVERYLKENLQLATVSRRIYIYRLSSHRRIGIPCESQKLDCDSQKAYL